MSSKVNKGLYTVNSGELPIWANNICRWLGYEMYVNNAFNRITKLNEEREKKSWLYKLFHGDYRYPPAFIRDNPFPRPSATDLDKFQKEYPDMAKEWYERSD